MENEFKIEIKPTKDSLSLIRLIVSYFCQNLEYDINEIDNIKWTITKLLTSALINEMEEKKVRINLAINDFELIINIYLKDSNIEKKYENEKIINEINRITIKIITMDIIQEAHQEITILLKIKNRKTNE